MTRDSVSTWQTLPEYNRWSNDRYFVLLASCYASLFRWPHWKSSTPNCDHGKSSTPKCDHGKSSTPGVLLFPWSENCSCVYLFKVDTNTLKWKIGYPTPGAAVAPPTRRSLRRTCATPFAVGETTPTPRQEGRRLLAPQGTQPRQRDGHGQLRTSSWRRRSATATTRTGCALGRTEVRDTGSHSLNKMRITMVFAMM